MFFFLGTPRCALPGFLFARRLLFSPSRCYVCYETTGLPVPDLPEFDSRAQLRVSSLLRSRRNMCIHSFVTFLFLLGFGPRARMEATRHVAPPFTFHLPFLDHLSLFPNFRITSGSSFCRRCPAVAVRNPGFVQDYCTFPAGDCFFFPYSSGSPRLLLPFFLLCPGFSVPYPRNKG